MELEEFLKEIEERGTQPTVNELKKAKSYVNLMEEKEADFVNVIGSSAIPAFSLSLASDLQIKAFLAKVDEKHG